jgi:tetratricopeptide (TPR) repeat protein
MKKVILLALITLSVGMGQALGQNDTIIVAKSLSLARQLMDRGLYDESIELVDDADRLDPARTAVYSYERGLAQYLKEDYAAAIRSLSRAANFRDASVSVFEVLGDCYFVTGEFDLAFDTYLRGLDKYPESGSLYYGLGRIHFSELNYTSALDAFLEGIELDSSWPDNWFGAGAIYLSDDDKAFGMVDAETAVCLGPDSEFSEVTRQALMETYRTNIFFSPDSLPRLSFSAPVGGRQGDLEISFPKAYEMTLSRSVAGESTIDIPSLVKIRHRFVENWFAEGLNETHPSALLDYHRAIIEAGHFEAYNYWLFAPADPVAFDEWRFSNGEALEAFGEWFNQNPIIEL